VMHSQTITAETPVRSVAWGFSAEASDVGRGAERAHKGTGVTLLSVSFSYACKPRLVVATFRGTDNERRDYVISL
jgi:hypothetical protein